jgi:hypothetical protein
MNMSLLSCRFIRPQQIVAITAFVLMGTGFAAAQSTQVPLIAPVNEDPPCFCWSDGRKIAEGLTVCLRTPTGRRLASCDRVTNVMSWRISDEICPES